VKFLVDVQLPARLALLLNRAGDETIHTSDLPNGNASTDAQVVEIADAQDRVVITKDRDFRDGHLLRGSPRKLFEVHPGAATSHRGHPRSQPKHGSTGPTTPRRLLSKFR
jgi:predicted nuclease of predicted toxin-antitoxin system